MDGPPSGQPLSPYACALTSPLARPTSPAPPPPPACRNATLRSKAEAKPPTFLWVYGKNVLAHSGPTCRAVFDAAVQQYASMANVEPIESFAVDRKSVV